MTAPVVLPIAVALPEALAEAAELAGERVRSHLRALAAGLELPVDLQLAPPATSGRSTRIELTIGARRTVLPARSDDEPATVVEQVVRAAHHARASLVTDGVVEAIRSAWCADSGPQLDALDDLVRRAVIHGLRLGRLRDDAVTAGGWRAGDDTVDRIVDTQLEATGNLIDIRVGAAQHQTLDPPAEQARMFEMMRDGLFYELGVIHRIGPVTLDPALDPGGFCFGWRDLRSPVITGLAPDELLVGGAPAHVVSLGVDARAARNPANGAEVALVRGDGARATCEGAGMTTWTPTGHLVLHLAAELQREAGSFVSSGLVELYLLRLGQAFPALVAEVRRRFSVRFLATLLRGLLDEENSVRDLRTILENLLTVRGTTRVDFQHRIAFLPTSTLLYPSPDPRPPDQLTPGECGECVRIALRRYLSHKYTRGQNTLVVYLLAPAIEEAIIAPGRDRERMNAILAAIADEVSSAPPGHTAPVILTTVDVRRRLARLLRDAQPDVAVLSYSELSPDLNIRPIARISLD